MTRRWRFLIPFTVLGLTWRLALAVHVYDVFRPGSPTAGDADTYLGLAENILAGHGYTLDRTPPHTPYSFRPPTYPLFLATVLGLSGGSHGAVIFVQAVLDIATGFLLAWLAHSVWPYPPRLPWVAFSVWATCPAVGSFVGRILPEVVTTFLFVSSLVILTEAVARQSSVFVAASGGGALMLAILGRPQLVLALAVVPLLIVALARRPELNVGRRASRVVVHKLVAGAFVGALLVEAPWAVRNFRATGELSLLGSGLAERALAMAVVAEGRVEEAREVHRRLAEKGVGPHAGRAEWLGFALREIRARPTKYLSASLVRGVLLWASPRTAPYGITPSTIREAVASKSTARSLTILTITAALTVYYGVLLFLAMIGIWKNRHDRVFRALLWAGPVSITLSSMWVHLEARYALPAFPIVTLAAALALLSVRPEALPGPPGAAAPPPQDTSSFTAS